MESYALAVHSQQVSSCTAEHHGPPGFPGLEMDITPNKIFHHTQLKDLDVNLPKTHPSRRFNHIHTNPKFSQNPWLNCYIPC